MISLSVFFRTGLRRRRHVREIPRSYGMYLLLLYLYSVHSCNDAKSFADPANASWGRRHHARTSVLEPLVASIGRRHNTTSCYSMLAPRPIVYQEEGIGWGNGRLSAGQKVNDHTAASGTAAVLYHTYSERARLTTDFEYRSTHRLRKPRTQKKFRDAKKSLDKSAHTNTTAKLPT